MTQLRVGETHTRARKAKLLRGAKASSRVYAARVEDFYSVDEARPYPQANPIRQRLPAYFA